MFFENFSFFCFKEYCFCNHNITLKQWKMREEKTISISGSVFTSILVSMWSVFSGCLGQWGDGIIGW